MSSLIKNLLLSVLLPTALGFLAVIPIINSQNGYVAGYIFLPLFLLVVFASFGLFIGGLIATGIKGKPGLWVLLSSIMLLGGFLGTAMLAKEFEIGSYHEDPMIHYPPPIANKVLFKRSATNDEIERFWTEVVGYPTGEGSHWTRPGIEVVMRTAAEDGHEVVTFAFRPNATEDQKADIRTRINSYPPAYQYFENVPTAVVEPQPSLSSINVVTKKAIVTDSTNSNR